MKIELAHQIRAMVVHGLDADAELGRDFLGAVALGHELENLAFAVGQEIGRIAGGGIGDHIAEQRGDGGLGLPSASTEERAIVLECLVEGLAIRALREPDLDLGRLRAALGRVLPALLQS